MPIQQQVLQPGDVWEFLLKRGTTFTQPVTVEGFDLRLYDLFVSIWIQEGAASTLVLTVGAGIVLDGSNHALATFEISSSQSAQLVADQCYQLEMFGRLKTESTRVLPIINQARFHVIDSSPELV